VGTHPATRCRKNSCLFLGSLNGSLSSDLSDLLGLDLSLRGSSGHNGESVFLGGLVVCGGSVIGRGCVVSGSGVVGRGSVVGGGSVVDRGSLVGGSGLVNNGSGFVSDGGGLVSNGSGLVSGSRGSLVGRGGGSLVGGCGLVGGCIGINGLTLILDIGNISFRASTVGNNLYSAIRKVHSVLSSGVVVRPLLLLGEDGTVVGGIVDSILVVVVDWSSWVWIHIRSVRSGSWTSRVGSADKGSKKNLGSHLLCMCLW